MKLLLDGMTIEIKVTPDGNKTADRKATKEFIDELILVYLHAGNFTLGNGMQERANHYFHMGVEMDAVVRAEFQK